LPSKKAHGRTRRPLLLTTLWWLVVVVAHLVHILAAVAVLAAY
jgi:hypothetical protein